MAYYYYNSDSKQIWVKAGDFVYIYSEAIAKGSYIYAGGSMWVYNGGSATNPTVYSGGYLNVSYGGYVSNCVVNAGGTLNVAGGSAVNTRVASGAELYLHVTTTTYFSGSHNGWSFTVSSGNVSNITIRENGYIVLYSNVSAQNVTVSNGGYLGVTNGGIAWYTKVSSGGTFYCSAGGQAGSTTVLDGGKAYIDDTANFLTVSSGGSLYTGNGAVVSNLTVSSCGVLSMVVAPGTYIRGSYTQRSDSGSYYISQVNGYLKDFSVTSRGAIWIYSGGRADSIYVEKGNAYVSNGGLIQFAKVYNGGQLFVSSGGIASSSYVYGGGVRAYASGRLLHTEIYSGGAVHLAGSAEYAKIWNGTLQISSGGSATSVWVNRQDPLYTSGSGLLNIANGGVAEKVEVSSGAAVYVNEGGVLSNYYIAAGGKINGFTLLSSLSETGSNINISSAIVSSGDAARLYNRQKATSVTVNYGGVLYVSSGGTASIVYNPWGGGVGSSSGAVVKFLEQDAKIYYGGYHSSGLISKADTMNELRISSGLSAIVYNGGVANSTTVNDGGSLYVSSGGVANSTTVNSGGRMTISSGGTASIVYNPWGGGVGSSSGAVVKYFERDAKIYYGNNSSGIKSKYDSIEDFIVLSGLSAIVYSGGVANSITVDSWGCMTISSGGTATSIIENGGYVDVAGGANVSFLSNTISGLVLSRGHSMTVHSNTAANCTTVNSWGRMYIHSGGVANNTTVNYAGYMYICSGGTANSTTVNSGYMYISSGGTATEITENGGAVFDDYGANVTFASNTISGLTVSSFAMTIHSNTIAKRITVNSGGSIYIYSGGTATDIIWTPCVGHVVAANGAYVTYQSNYSGIYFGSNNALLSHTESMTGKIVSLGTMYVMSGGVANSTAVNFCGYMYIYGDGVANSTTVNSGDMYIYGGVANSTTVNYRGDMYIYGDGVANSTTVNSGGTMYISSGGTANDTTVNYWGRMYISSGGTANSTTLNSDGTMYISSGGTANSTTVNSDGRMYISSGGTANDTTVNYWGDMYIYSGGVANSTTVNSRGYLYISSGGTANSTTVNSGYMYISSGGTATSIIENGGYVVVAGGANVSFLSNSISGVVLSNRSMTVHSNTVANSTTVNSSGAMYIYSGGTANSTTVSRGWLYIYSGGVANSTTVNGGYLYISSGVANSTTVNGGYMYISSGGTATSIIENGGYVDVAGGANVSFLSNTISGLVLSRGHSMTVHSNTAANCTTVNSSGAMYIYSGGTANDTTVNYMGDMYIYSGGTANSTTVNSRGYLGIISGGTATNIVASSGARLGITVASNTYIQGTYVGSAFEMKDAQISGYTVNTDGRMYIYSGGVANSTTVNSGGYLYISSGGTANSTVLSGYYSGYYYQYSANMYISSGGVANSTTVNSGGKMYISSGGVANSTTVNSSGAMYISSGGTANSTTVSYGYLYISSGGTATDVHWIPCVGRVNAANGAYVTYTSNYSGVYFGSNDELLSHTQSMSNKVVTGSMYVMNDGVANSTTVNSRGYLYISSGGVANSTTVKYGGYMYISSGGVANSTTVNREGSMHISSGGVANSTVLSGGTGYYDSAGMYISSGGVANSTTVSSGGYLYISSGGTAIDVVWTPCVGNVYAADGAYVTYVNQYSGVYFGSANQLLSHTQSMSNKVVSGPMYVMNGGVANSTTVNSGGRMYIYSGGVANSTTVNSDGYLYISSGGVANNTTVNSWGDLYISSGGVANSTTVSYGYLRISSGGVANSTTVNSRGYLYISSGGVANSTVLSGGTGYYDSAVMYISSGGVANSTTVNSGYMYISSGGVANSTTVNSGGRMYISSGGVANSTTVNGGYLYIFSGGVANNTTVSSGGLHISSGCVANSTTVSGGDLRISSGGVANSTTVDRYGYLRISSGGVANSTTVNSSGRVYIEKGGVANSTTVGGYLGIYYGGVANSTTVNSYGYLFISSGGVANSTTVNSYGYLFISSGGVANSTTVNSRGRMYISSCGVHRGSLQLESGAVVSAYSGALIDFTVADRKVEDGYLINDLSLITGTPTYTVTVDDQLVSGTYKLAQGASNFTGTLTIGDGTVDYGSITVNGADFVYNGVTYSLDQLDGDLTLTIKAPDIIPPELTITGNATTPTNQNVVLKISANENCTILYNIDNGEWQTYSGGITLTANGIVNIKATDKAGNVTEKSVTVDMIDKVAPAIELSADITTPTNGNVVLTATVSDGIVEYYANGKWVTGESLTVEANGTYQFRVTDVAGNVTTKNIEVTNIDKIPPTLEITASEIKPTNKNVILTATVSDGTVEYFADGKWNTGSSLTVNVNGTYQFRVTDEAGNITEKSITVANIDKVAPTLELTANITTPTNGNVVLTAAVSDGMVEYFNGTDWVAGTKYIVSTNGIYQFRVTDEAGNVTQKSIVVSNINKVAPTIELTADVTTPTNGNVVLTAKVSDGMVEYFVDGKWTAGNKLTVSENGTYQFRVTDEAGNITEKSITVTNIDKVAPKVPCAVASTTDPTNKNVTVSVTYSEDSTVKQYKIGEKGQWVDYTQSFAVENNDTIYFRAEDAAGNESVSELAITNIDKVAPTLEIVADVTTPTNGNVVLTAKVSDGTVEYYANGKWVTGESLTVEANGTYQFRVTDVAGNVAEKSIEVTNIDTTAPTIELTADITTPTNGNVTLTAKVSDGTVEYYANGKWVTGESLTVEANGTYQFRVTDAAGNVTEKNFEVTNIDKSAPEIQINCNPADWTNKNISASAAASDISSVKSLLYSLDSGKTWQDYTDGIEMAKNGWVHFRAIDNAGNVTTKGVLINKIDKAAPVLTITGNVENYTNKNVTVSVTAKDGTSGIKTLLYSLDSGKTWSDYADGIIMAKNGWVHFRAIDNAGNVTTKGVLVNKIDKVAPVLTITGNVENYTNKNVTISATAKDGTSGIKSLLYSLDSGKTWNDYTNAVVMSKNGWVHFRAIDNAGNISTKGVLVNKIDKTAPVIQISGLPVEYTSETVTISATAKDGACGVKSLLYSLNSGKTWQTYTAGVTFTKNGWIHFRATDNLGNMVTKGLLVNKIDKTAPVLQLNTSGNKVSAVSTDKESGLAAFEYSFDGKTWVATANHKAVTLKDGDSVTFRAIDKVGNVTQTQYDYNTVDYNALKNYDLFNSNSTASDLTGNNPESDIMKGLLA